MITAPHRPHPYQQGYASVTCICGRARAYRTHQPLLWRILHPWATWR
jgi:hypothetical protein